MNKIIFLSLSISFFLLSCSDSGSEENITSDTTSAAPGPEPEPNNTNIENSLDTLGIVRTWCCSNHKIKHCATSDEEIKTLSIQFGCKGFSHE